MILIWLKFAICIAIIFFSGKRVAKYGKDIQLKEDGVFTYIYESCIKHGRNKTWQFGKTCYTFYNNEV